MLNGEKYFRNIEESISLKSLKLNNKVIALGGGGYINPIIRKYTQKKCISKFKLIIHIFEISTISHDLTAEKRTPGRFYYSRTQKQPQAATTGRAQILLFFCFFF